MEYVYFLIGLLLLAVIVRWQFARVTVKEYERGIKFVRGKITQVLEPGVYWIWRWNTEIQKFDSRERVLHLPGQEVLSADGITIKVSLVVKYKVEDPKKMLLATENLRESMYAVLQVGVRNFVGSLPIEELLQNRAKIAPAVEEFALEAITEIGVKLLMVEVKDIMFPGELKHLFSEELRARKAGLAALERARGETAALRNLANAASLLKDNPALMQLRTIQALNEASGNTVVVNLSAPEALVPMPKEKKKK